MTSQLILGAAIGIILALILTPLTIRFARKVGLVDDPITHNHPAIIHKGIIPRAGGLPVYIAIVLTYLFLADGYLTKQMVGIFIGGLLLVVVGMIDDKYDVSPYIRFIINVLIAVIVVGFGVGIAFITNPYGGVITLNQIVIPFTFAGSAHTIVVLADIVALLWIVWMMNAINWSSGVDGQLSGIVAIGAIILGLAAWRFAQNDPTQLPVVYLAIAIAAAYIGFLPYSAYPQKIMPGYGGAALGGFLLAVLAIFSGARLATALIVLAVPMADGAWAIIRRLQRGHSPFRGDSEHLHHQLLKLGYSKPQVSLFYWGTCAILGVLALQLDSRGKLFAVVLLAAIFGGLILWFRYLLTSSNRRAPGNGPRI